MSIYYHSNLFFSFFHNSITAITISSFTLTDSSFIPTNTLFSSKSCTTARMIASTISNSLISCVNSTTITIISCIFTILPADHSTISSSSRRCLSSLLSNSESILLLTIPAWECSFLSSPILLIQFKILFSARNFQDLMSCSSLIFVLN